MLFEAESTRFIKRLAIALLLGFALALVAMNVLDPARNARLTMLERHQSRMESLNDKTQRDNDRLQAELTDLRTGVRGWHDIARRDHNMILDGEVIYHFPTD